MQPDSPKQVQIRQREERIIRVALDFIEGAGFSALTMEYLAREIGCSKGTIYNHFINKEDLLCELGARYFLEQQLYYKKLDDFSGHSREQAMGLFLAYQIFSFLNPALFSCVLSLHSAAVLNRASSRRLNHYRQQEMAVVARLVNLIQVAIQLGDLDSAYQSKVFQLAFTGWATAFGNISLMMSSQGALLTQQAEREAQLFSAVQIVLDGVHWRPLSEEFNYEQSWRLMGEQLYASELKRLYKQDL